MNFLRVNLAAAIAIGLAATASAQRLVIPLRAAPRGPVAVAAQSPGDSQLLRQFCGKGNLVWLQIVDGRIALKSRSAAGNLHNTNQSSNGHKESIQINLNNAHPRLVYERTTPDEQLSINAGDTVSIRREPKGKKSSVVSIEFQQSADDVKISVDVGDRRQTFRARDLWRLLITQREQCRNHLIPLLELIRPDWKLADTAADVEKRLLALAGAGSTAGHDRWDSLVKQLGDDRFTQREAADRALRAGGAAALAYLRQLDQNRLDAEQQFRVRRIIEATDSRNDNDTPDEVAALLFRDPVVWLALLERPDPATRQTAASRLAALLGNSIDIDPAAEPNSQKDKREKLRARIERK